MPMVRKDSADIVYKSERAKFEAVVDEIIREHQKGRPVLVGTRSIEKSELLAAMLRRKGVECNVLNAKYHEQEAEIIKDAGQEAQVTIATNMAGRGTDIKLGRRRSQERRPAHYRDRAARVAADRQPVARPFRSSRRSRFYALLRVA